MLLTRGVICSLLFISSLLSVEFNGTKNSVKPSPAKFFIKTVEESDRKKVKEIHKQLSELLPFPAVLINLTMDYCKKVPKWAIHKAWHPKFDGYAMSLSCDKSLQYMACGGVYGYVRALCGQDYENVTTYKSSGGSLLHSVNMVLFSPCGQKFAAASNDDTVMIWDISKKTCERILNHKCHVEFLAWAPCGKKIFSITFSNAKVWDVQSGLCTEIFPYRDKCNGCTWTNQGIFIVTSQVKIGVPVKNRDVPFKIVNIRTEESIRTFSGHKNWIVRVFWAPNNRYIASSGMDGEIRVWDIESGNCVNKFVGHGVWDRDIAFSPCSEYIAAGSSVDRCKHTLNIWRFADSKCMYKTVIDTDSMPTDNIVSSVTWSYAGKIVACNRGGSFIVLTDLTHQQPYDFGV